MFRCKLRSDRLNHTNYRCQNKTLREGVVSHWFCEICAFFRNTITLNSNIKDIAACLGTSSFLSSSLLFSFPLLLLLKCSEGRCVNQC